MAVLDAAAAIMGSEDAKRALGDGVEEADAAGSAKRRCEVSTADWHTPLKHAAAVLTWESDDVVLAVVWQHSMVRRARQGLHCCDLCDLTG